MKNMRLDSAATDVGVSSANVNDDGGIAVNRDSRLHELGALALILTRAAGCARHELARSLLRVLALYPVGTGCLSRYRSRYRYR